MLNLVSQLKIIWLATSQSQFILNDMTILKGFLLSSGVVCTAASQSQQYVS